jgi:hypothetical protein
MVPELQAAAATDSTRWSTAHGERPTGEQHLATYRVGSLLVGGKRELCLVKQISGRPR